MQFADRMEVFLAALTLLLWKLVTIGERSHGL